MTEDKKEAVGGAINPCSSKEHKVVGIGNMVNEIQSKLNELNIACIYSANLGNWGGGTAGLKNMLHIFKRLKIIEINLVSYSYYSNKFRIEHGTIKPLSNSTTIHFPSSLPDFLKALFSILLAFIYAWKPAKKCDIIFAILNVLSAVPAVILGKVFGKPVILHYTDIEPRTVPDCVYKYIYKYIVKNADIVFAISPYLTNKAKTYCENIVYLPAFVDTNLFNIDPNARKGIRADFRIEEDDIVIGYAGQFSYIEGVSNLLQAFKNLLRCNSNIKMIIMGGKQGKNDEDIPKLAKDFNFEDKVTVVPPQPHEQVPKFLSACDILCCPKIDCERNRVAHPIKVVEYLSMGLPTVCSSVGGITYTIEDGTDGFLVKPGDVKDLEEKLEWVIFNPERAKEIGENGRKKAIDKYSYEAIENTVRQAITEIIYRKRKTKINNGKY